MARREPQSTVPAKPTPRRAADPRLEADDGDAEFAAWLGERVRRVALGLLAALIVARAFWPSEPDLKAAAGTGLLWDLAILATAGLAVASALIGGTFRVRWSWTDAAVVALMFLVGLSSTQAYDRLIAINLAWDWAAIGVAYVLARNLPRTRAESSALLGGLVATAIALAVYGLYQVAVEQPEMQLYYKAHKAQVLRELQIAEGSPAQTLYEHRLFGSNEPTSTFALANSLAGFLVGPLIVMLVVGWESLFGHEPRVTRLTRLALGALPALAVLVCLLLTKSRSAYIGLAVGLAILAWRERRRVSVRTLLLTGLGGVVVLSALIVAGVATHRLDRQVLTETTKSLRYRGEYWVGAWRVITATKAAFWKGHGPGNFTAPYLLHKVPESSEELYDPHNLVLEVWATAGVVAMVALLAALGLGFRELFARGTVAEKPAQDRDVKPPLPRPEPSDPPRRVVWLIVCAGAGWVAASLVGHLDPFREFWRWLILGGAWVWAVLFGMAIWRRLTIPAVALGAGALAIAINLLAAGGIGIAGVALMLWTLIALGLNLREDRGCGRLRDVGGRLPAFGMMLVWTALIGSYFGAILPYWNCEAALAKADAALQARPPRYEAAEAAYDDAKHADRCSARPYLGLAYLYYQQWEERGAKPEDKRWKMIAASLLKAAEAPRNPNSWNLHHERAVVCSKLLRRIGSGMSRPEFLSYRASIVEATRKASHLYPSNATLHGELAEASAEMGMFGDAVSEARKALDLDKRTPHADKKLSPALRKRLNDSLPGWEKSAPGTPDGEAAPKR